MGYGVGGFGAVIPLREPRRYLVEQLIRDDEDIALADITLTEILQGIKTDREYRDVKASLADLFAPLSERSRVVYRRCGALPEMQKGLTIRSTVDLLVAQIALEHGTALLHNDRNFDALAQVCDLRVYDGSHREK